MTMKFGKLLLLGALALAASVSIGQLVFSPLRSSDAFVPLGSLEHASTPPPSVTGDPYADDYRYLTWLLREKWAWLELREKRGLDLEALEEEALALSREEEGPRGFLRGLTRYVSGISDGHGAVSLDGVDLQESKQWPFCMVEVEEGIMVDGISPTLFTSGEMKPGDLVIGIDGKPIDAVIEEYEQFVIASSPGARRSRAIHQMTKSTKQERLRVDFLSMSENRRVLADLPSVQLSEPVPHLSWMYLEPKCEVLDETTTYWRISSFTPTDSAFGTATAEERISILGDQFDGYAKHFELIAQRPNLILDLRENGGGTDLLAQAIALHLMPSGFLYLKNISKRVCGEWKGTRYWKPEVGRGTPRFEGRVICLIDEGCFSVTDNFLSCLRDERANVRFVGQPSGAGSGAPRTYPLPSTGASVRFCTMRVRAANGNYIEGISVQPDLLIRATRAQRLAKEDAVLQAGLTLRLPPR